MKVLRPQILAAFLQLAPLARVFQAASPRLAISPAIAILRWIFSASAVAGGMHAVSGASGISPTTIRATNGIRTSTTFIVSDSTHGTAKSYSTTSPLPPGLALSTRGILSGTPTSGGSWTLAVRGWQNADQSGDSALKDVAVTVVNTIPPAITSPPTNITVAAGGIATFAVAFTGHNPVSIRWFKEDIEVTRGTNSTLSLTNVTATTAGRYRVRLSNSVSTIFSDFVTLTVENPNPPPGIAAQVLSQTVHQGETVRLSVSATGSGLSYAWTHNSQPIPGDASLITLANVSTNDAGTYAVHISNAGGSTNSIGATLTVIDPLHLDPPKFSGGDIELRFTGVEGRRYELESAPDLISTFSPVTEVLGRASGAVMTLAPTNTSRVFRVRSVN